MRTTGADGRLTLMLECPILVHLEYLLTHLFQTYSLLVSSKNKHTHPFEPC